MLNQMAYVIIWGSQLYHIPALGAKSSFYYKVGIIMAKTNYIIGNKTKALDFTGCYYDLCSL